MFRNLLLCVLLILNFSVLLGQQVISNPLTKEYKEIRGSKVSIIPPSDFTISKNFMGFQQVETNSSIMVLDMPTSYTTVIKGFTKENFEKVGLKIESIDTLIINHRESILVKGVQFIYEQNYTKYILAFGTDSETIMINGACLVEEHSMSEQIKKAILTTVYDSTKILSPLDAVDFRIQTKDTGFTFSKSITNMLIYKKEVSNSENLSDNRSFVVSKSISKSNFTDKKEFVVNRMKGLSMQVNKINSVVEVSINNLQGYEVIADGVNRKTGQNEQAFLTILFKDLDYYILYGSSAKDFEQDTASFRKLTRTFELK